MARIGAALLLWLLCAAPAWAASDNASRRVAVLAAERDDPVVRRLRDELGALGFESVTVTPPLPAPEPAALRELGRRLDVAAVIAVSSEQDTLSISVADRVTGKVVLRAIPMPSNADGDQARVIALRAVELLRASLRELESDPRPPGSEVAATQATRALLRPATPRAGFDIGPAIAGAPGGVGPSAHVSLGVRWFVAPRWSLGLRSLIPTVPAKISDDEGFARITIAVVDLTAMVALRRPTALVVPELGVAPGFAVMRMDGAAESGFTDRTQVLLTASIRVQAGLAVSIHPNVRLRVDAHLGTLFPRPTIRFVDREVGRWGQPYGVGSLGVEFVF